MCILLLAGNNIFLLITLSLILMWLTGPFSYIYKVCLFNLGTFPDVDFINSSMRIGNNVKIRKETRHT